ncbi:HAD-IA family hydrolase [Salinispirillum sp. LH 10-3-1]|uniref:HAD-IA family hydrolase n=1 Tax=Salinispirillum sp. LH 10-3-1 TaxID=2952525 RepID=A0AB38YF17_9GAMM
MNWLTDIRWLFLDMDHTLVDFNLTERNAFADLCAYLNVSDVGGAFATFLEGNRPLWPRLEAGEINAAELRYARQRYWLEQYRVDADPSVVAQHYETCLGNYVDWFDGVPEILQEWRQRFGLALITNGLSNVKRQQLKQMAGLFSAVSISEEVGAAKPAAAFFQHTLAQITEPLRPEQVLVVGDNYKADILGGKAMGFRTCWIGDESEHAKKEGADIAVSALPKLAAFLRRE